VICCRAADTASASGTSVRIERLQTVDTIPRAASFAFKAVTMSGVTAAAPRCTGGGGAPPAGAAARAAGGAAEIMSADVYPAALIASSRSSWFNRNLPNGRLWHPIGDGFADAD